MKYLSTGGAGFIGSNIAEELLNRGHQVRVLDNFSTGRRENLSEFLDEIELIEGDLRTYHNVREAVDGMDFVLHQGALPSVPRSVSDPITSNEVNVTGTLNVVYAAKDARVKRVVFASSSSIYGDSPVAEKIVNVLALSGKPLDPFTKKPVVVALLGSTLIEDARAAFSRARVPTYPFPERAASAFGALVKRAEILTREVQGYERVNQFQSPGDSVASPDPENLLRAYGIETAPVRLAHAMDEAEFIANEIGYPVVMMIASPDILHESDAGGVILNIQDAPSLHIAYTQIMKRIAEARPEARIEGVQ